MSRSDLAPNEIQSSVLLKGATMRVYFHLRDTDQTIHDFMGVEVLDVEEARAEAMHAVEELWQEDAAAVDSWSGWSLQAVDGSGRVLFCLDLDSLTS